MEVDHRNRMEMNGVFTWELGKGEHSRILFKQDGVELAELIYNPKHTERENDNLSISNLVVPTVAQKPDIVLQLTKNDSGEGTKDDLPLRREISHRRRPDNVLDARRRHNQTLP